MSEKQDAGRRTNSKRVLKGINPPGWRRRADVLSAPSILYYSSGSFQARFLASSLALCFAVRPEVWVVEDAKQTLNGACQYVGELVARLRPGDESSIQAVKAAFATLEGAIARVNSDLDRLRSAVGPVKIPPDHVRQ